MNQDIVDVAADMASMANYRLHAEQLVIPVLQGLQVQNNANPQVIILASGQGYVEQFLSDGYIAEGDFEKRIDLVINNSKEFMKNNGCENVENSFLFHKNYSNGIFDFKVYVQDMIANVNNVKTVIRQFNAFFIEPQMSDFYQLSLSAGPFNIPTQQLKVGVIDLQNDQITKILDSTMTAILNNIKYKN